MLDKIDLSRKLDKGEYKQGMTGLDFKLASLQREIRALGIPVTILFEGWEAAGKGTLINKLIIPLDPRGFTVENIMPPSVEETLRPPLWRFWMKTPPGGRIAVFDRSWYRQILDAAVAGGDPANSEGLYQDINSFEHLLTDGGQVIIKFFLHISRGDQKRRFKKLRSNPVTAWRVTAKDMKLLDHYDEYLPATERMLVATDSAAAPWTVVEARNERFATLKIFTTVINALDKAVARRQAAAAQPPPPAKSAPCPVTAPSVLGKIDLDISVGRDTYAGELKKKQKLLRELEYKLYRHRVPVVILYEGSDAAGKGGNIRRITERLDPRGYEVVPIAAPNDLEKSHHYLWRFWRRIPKAGHIAIFDRTWYGRVLVERVEGFCPEADWRRAYREINEMERHLTNFGAVLVKFWLQIDKDEQLRRFEERQRVEHKQWKITDEDWRNREKWDEYRLAVDEMLLRTSTPYAPWTVVESNCKRFARLKAIDTVIKAITNKV